MYYFYLVVDKISLIRDFIHQKFSLAKVFIPMKKNFVLILLMIVLTACSQTPPTQSTESKQLTVVWAIHGTEVMHTSVAALLTASALAPKSTTTLTQTLVPTTLVETNTPVPTNTVSPFYPTLTVPPTDITFSTLTPFPTNTKTPQGPCYLVVDPWCSNHQGCSTLSVYNKTTSAAILTLKNNSFGVNTTLKIPPNQIAGTCTIVLRPGNYYYEFTYCDRFDKGNHAMNDNWYIIFKCQ